MAPWKHGGPHRAWCFDSFPLHPFKVMLNIAVNHVLSHTTGTQSAVPHLRKPDVRR